MTLKKDTNVLRLVRVTMVMSTIIAVVNLILIRIMIRFNIINSVIKITDVVLLSASVLAIVYIGKSYASKMSRVSSFKSASVISIYYVIIVVVEQILLANKLYPNLLFLIFFPVEIFSRLSYFIYRLPISLWWGVVFSILSPFLLVIFAKGTKENDAFE